MARVFIMLDRQAVYKSPQFIVFYFIMVTIGYHAVYDVVLTHYHICFPSIVNITYVHYYLYNYYTNKPFVVYSI